MFIEPQHYFLFIFLDELGEQRIIDLDEFFLPEIVGVNFDQSIGVDQSECTVLPFLLHSAHSHANGFTLQAT